MKEDKRKTSESMESPEDAKNLSAAEEDFEELSSELEEVERKLKEAEEKILRQAADHDNFRKRIMRETDDKIRYANQSLLAKFLPVIDNFELALSHLEGASAESIAQGIALNHKLMLDTLEKAGLSPIPAAEGDAFDPAVHEAVMLSHREDLPDNAIAKVVQNGYKMGDRVVRPAKVQVNKPGQ